MTHVGAKVRQNDGLGEMKLMLLLFNYSKKCLKAPLPRNKKSFEYKSE